MKHLFLPLVFFGFAILHADDWPEYQGKGRKAVWNETGIIGKFESDTLTPKWKVPIGPGYGGPTVAGDKVYVMDHGKAGNSTERILCFSAKDGSPVWDHEYDCVYGRVGYGTGPRACVTIADGKAYAFGTMGHLHCLDAATGDVIWAKNLADDYEIDMPIWGLTSSPLVEAGKVIVQAAAARDGACILAFDTATGKEAWRAFSDKAGYVSPMMIDQPDGKRALLAWTGFRIAGMNAETGEVYWEIPTKPNKMPINVPNPAVNADGTLLFLSVFYDGSRLIRLTKDGKAEEVWHRQGINERKTDALHCMISPPFFQGDHIYGVDSYGQFRCLDPKTGDRLWENLTVTPEGRWSTVFPVQNGDQTWMLNEQGELIIGKVSPEGYSEISRAKLLEPATPLKQRRSGYVVWSPPAFAHKCVFARNDKELVCADLSAD
ncbi:MAG: PQQ-like beta-propeller repeat protein [Verrucomicrobiales bacterium]|nr:PQQ-like beta-propeller repeat protein [Verrucomicrobiales bacterium]